MAKNELLQLLAQYGFNKFKHGSSHIHAYHPNRTGYLTIPSTPSRRGRIRDNVEAEIRRFLGLSNRGRTAIPGQRNQRKEKKRQQPQQLRKPESAQVRTLEEIRAERRLINLDKMMRERP
jgi:predicted RNA binding protein YcfA (HicA-like mRNA interferase family)